MHSALALGLLIALSASADAATVHQSRVHHHHVVLPAGAASSFAAVRRQAYPQPWPPVHYNDIPSYDDPSKLGGY